MKDCVGWFGTAAMGEVMEWRVNATSGFPLSFMESPSPRMRPLHESAADA